MWLSLIVLLGGCDQIKAWTGGGDEAAPPDPNPVTAAPVPLDLRVKGGEISVVAVKNGDTEVPATLGGVSGEFEIEDPATTGGFGGELHIDLSSWDSKLEERDNNVRNVFFEMTAYPKAVFALEDIEGLPSEGVGAGLSAEGEAKGALSLHGTSIPLTARVRVSRAGDDTYHVDTVEPFFLSVEAFGLTPRLRELIKVCGHKSVDDNMRVSLSIDLEPAPPGAQKKITHKKRKPTAVRTGRPAVRPEGRKTPARQH